MISLARQDRYLRIVHEYLDRGLSPADAARLLAEARALDREQRRTLGTDAPIRTETMVTPGELAPVPDELVELVQQAREEAEEEEQRARDDGG